MRPHRLDTVSLVFGLVYAGVGLAALLGGTSVGLRGGWLWPAVAVALGVALLVSLRSRARDRSDTRRG